MEVGDFISSSWVVAERPAEGTDQETGGGTLLEQMKVQLAQGSFAALRATPRESQHFVLEQFLQKTSGRSAEDALRLWSEWVSWRHGVAHILPPQQELRK